MSIAESGTRLTAVAYLLDTNIFNQLVDARISIAELPNDGPFLATYLQIQELGNTKSQDRREVLLSKFQEVNPQTVPVETSVWGITPYGEGQYGGDSDIFNSLLAEHNAKSNAKKSNLADVLIAEVAIVNGHTLITADQDLADLMESSGGKFIRFAVS